jgi:hypothetical protein
MACDRARTCEPSARAGRENTCADTSLCGARQPFVAHGRRECNRGTLRLAEWELRACAQHYITEHGADAPVIAAMRCDELLDACDYEGARTFHAIIERINRLLDGPSGALH